MRYVLESPGTVKPFRRRSLSSFVFMNLAVRSPRTKLIQWTIRSLAQSRIAGLSQ